MSEIVVLVETYMSIVQIILVSLCIVAGGLIAFDRGARTPKSTRTSRSSDRAAA